MNIKEVISKDLSIPYEIVEEAINNARHQILQFKIPKKTGGTRLIYQPSKKLKIIQYWLMHNVFEKLPVHEAAMAYRKGLSILDNAKIHKGNKYFLKIDLKDFFPSIQFTDLFPLIEKWHTHTKPSWNLDFDAINLIRLSCFYKNDALTIGYPSSPVISNAVMYDFDLAIEDLIGDQDKYGQMIYTRYADDLIFSTNKQNVSSALLGDLNKHVKSMTSPLISINSSKTKSMSSSGGSAYVTGLKVCEDNHVTINRKQKDHIRLLLGLLSKNKLKKDEYSSLMGHISYIHHVDPAFYSKIQMKFFKEIKVLQGNIDPW